jgi:hypothetical protein
VDRPGAAALRAALEAHFDITPGGADPVTDLEAAPDHSMVLVARGLDAPWILRLSDAGRRALEAALPEASEAVRGLDVSALHELVIDRVYGVDREAQSAKTNLRYFRDPRAALAQLEDEQVAAVVLLKPTPVHAVAACADASDVMPQKSTDFFPKILAGLVHLDLSEGETL